MNTMPQTLRDSLPANLILEAENWWSELSDDDRDELARLCDSRREIFLFETFDPSRENQKITGGKFIPHDDGFGIQEWGEDWFDSLLSSPELMIVYEPQIRTFHIGCSRHVAARICFQDGIIHDYFRCPLSDDQCLMDRIRKGRSSIGLKPVIKTENGNEQSDARKSPFGREFES